jgi:hypothetical protein
MYKNIVEQAASNKSSLILVIQNQNSQTLQLFTEIFKTEKYFRRLLKHEAGRLWCTDLVV